jgi:hypothetical protein
MIPVSSDAEPLEKDYMAWYKSEMKKKLDISMPGRWEVTLKKY